jgi:hypothetical protein
VHYRVAENHLANMRASGYLFQGRLGTREEQPDSLEPADKVCNRPRTAAYRKQVESNPGLMADAFDLNALCFNGIVLSDDQSNLSLSLILLQLP